MSSQDSPCSSLADCKSCSRYDVDASIDASFINFGLYDGHLSRSLADVSGPKRRLKS